MSELDPSIVNRAKQLNPTSDAFWKVLGWSRRPKDWAERVKHAREIGNKLNLSKLLGPILRSR